MKKVTKIAGIIAMVAVMAFTVSCSKNEASSGNSGSAETAASTAKSGDGLAGTVWQREDGIKITFAETDSMLLLQDPETNFNNRGFYTVFGNTLIIEFESGHTSEYVLAGDTLTAKSDGSVYTKVK